MSAATDGAEIVKLAQEHAELKPLVDAIAAVNAKRKEIADLEEMDKEGGDLARPLSRLNHMAFMAKPDG